MFQQNKNRVNRLIKFLKQKMQMTMDRFFNKIYQVTNRKIINFSLIYSKHLQKNSYNKNN